MNVPDFINDVALFLARRDTSAFNPGARAKASPAKSRVVEVSLSEGAQYAAAIAEHWPADVIVNGVMAEIIDPKANASVNALIRATAAEAGFRPIPRPVWLAGKNVRIHVIRNHEQWLGADGSQLAAEVRRGVPSAAPFPEGWRDFIDGIASGGGFE